MKKYLSVFAASVFILSAAGCSSGAVNTVGGDVGSSSVGASGVGSGGAPGSGVSSGAAEAGGSSEGGTAGGTASERADEASSTVSPTGTVSTAAATGSSDAASGTSAVADPSEAALKDSSKSTAEYGPTDIGGLGTDVLADVDDGFYIEDEFAFGEADIAPSGGDVEIGVDGDYDIIECPVDPYEEYIQPSAGLLTGGEWRDNDHWADWQALYSSHSDWAGYKSEWRVDFDERIAVNVTSGGAPVEGAKVTSDSGTSAITDNSGRAYLFFPTGTKSAKLTVEYNGETKTVSGDIGTAVDVELSAAAEKLNKLDLMIMCDTTGSMYDELSYLQVELTDIVERIQSANANIGLRLSVNFYRDEGDEYVVREYPFTEDINAAVTAISQQHADGGGDFPEAVHTALDSAINGHDWDEDSVKIMFLVLDAPPHSDDVQIVDSVRASVERAAEMGIRIIPIASSGVDKSTEYLLRTMSFVTGGTYTFLTDDSGIGGGHIEPTVGAFNVEKLNDMMVRIVNGYLG